MASVKDFYNEAMLMEFSQESFDTDVLINKAIVLEKEIEALDFYINNYDSICEHYLEEGYYVEDPIDKKEGDRQTKRNLQLANKEKQQPFKNAQAERQKKIDEAESTKSKGKGWFTKIINWIATKLGTFADFLLDRCKDVKKGWNEVMGKINSKIPQEIKDKINREIAKIAQKFSSIKKGGIEIITKAGNTIKGAADSVADHVNNAAGKVGDRLKIAADKINFRLTNIDGKIPGAITIEDCTNLMNKLSANLDKINWGQLKDQVWDACDRAKKNFPFSIDSLSSDKSKLRELSKHCRMIKGKKILQGNGITGEQMKEAKSALTLIQKVVAKTMSIYSLILDYKKKSLVIVKKYLGNSTKTAVELTNAKGRTIGKASKRGANLDSYNMKQVDASSKGSVSSEKEDAD